MTTLGVVGGPAAAAPEPPPSGLGSRPAAADTRTLTADQAAARARTTKQAVEATEAASETDTLIANADGSFTLTRTAVPTRARIGSSWQTLDPNLAQNADGTWSPRASSTPLKLSNGGEGAMATMSHAGLSAGIVPPQSLNPPEITGDTATYKQVLPGVDLRVTARITGGFSEVFVVHDEESGENPDLENLTMPTQLSGMTLAADTTGNITGSDRTGATVLTSPAPVMWDSTTGPATKSGPAPTRSSFRGPGSGAKIAPVKAAVTNGKIQLTPDRKLLADKKTKYPVYIDPAFTWSAVGAKNNGWATLPETFPNSNYWRDTPDPRGRMQVGNPSNQIKSRTFINFPIATSTLTGATIHTAVMKITQTRAWSCNPSRVNLHAPATVLTARNATWTSWRNQSLGSVIDSKNVAHGYEGCPAGGVAFDIKDAVGAAVTQKKATQTFALVADDENSDNGWKEFLETSPTIEITYNHRPDTPTGLSTSPPTACSAASPTVVGDGEMTLYAPVSDRNGSTLGVIFSAWKTNDPSVIVASSNQSLTYRSKTTAAINVKVDKLRAASGYPSNPVVTQFSWKVQVTDLNLTSAWSVTCNFKFDPTRPGPPVLTPIGDGTKIGESVTVNIAKPLTGDAPASYLYQLNGGPYGQVKATDGSAEIAVTPRRFMNTLTVTSVSAGGNIGDSKAAKFNSDPAERAFDGDFDGDGLSDLVVPGSRYNLAPGLWFSAGESNGKLAPAAVNLGSRGNGAFATENPSDFDGAQVVPGRFAGTGLQDVFVYYPSGTHAGEAVILRGNGDGSPIQAQLSGTYEKINAGTFLDQNGLDPVQLINAGHSPDSAYPDLLGIVGNADISYLNYFPNKGSTGNYPTIQTLSQQRTPTGQLDWNTWTLTSAPIDGRTTIFLWQKSSGKLYAWDNVIFDTVTGVMSFTQRTVAVSWNAGKDITPYSGDINGDGSPDLWAVGAGASAAASLITANGIVNATPETVLTANHAWNLKDAEDGAVTGEKVAKDRVGMLNLTGSASAAWTEGDVFDRSVRFDGSTGMLTTAGPAFATNNDFSVSAWVKLDRTSGTLFSQDGTYYSGVKVWIDDATDSWRFSMSTANTNSPTWVNAIARNGTARVGVWTHISASYTRSTGTLDLHINGKDAATAVMLPSWNATGVFRVGASGSANNPPIGFLQGQVAEVLTYTSVIIYDAGNPNIRDFSGDNKTDIFAVHGGDGRIFMYRGNGAGQFIRGAATVGTGFADKRFIVGPGDFDSDGNEDMLACWPNGNLFLFKGNGAGGWLNGGSPDAAGSGWHNHSAVTTPGDFDRDGFPDIISRREDGHIYLYRGNGAGLWRNGNDPLKLSTGNAPFAHYARLFSAGDFSGDGKPDLFAVAGPNDPVPGKLFLYRGDGSNGWLNGNAPDHIGDGWLNHTAIWSPGDFNGDGFSDVMTRESNGQILLYRGDGAGNWQNRNRADVIGDGSTWNSMNKFM
ncbi:FG-GAP-like repeat-containing protein [Actinoplanes sp. NBRC 103695]|uniref:FG-GAP-like repeat-containing protein n=1 Tax=Actinoplanes sp. NBRC 103695 TaxID=3032202 RepID=UPI00255653FE|nr:FG-GAP-like repeat-containing protein [Actinoplanes sp. NBRC 103695]